MDLHIKYTGNGEEESVKIGELVWENHSGTDFSVPFSLEVGVSDDTLSVTLVGMQYVDFSDFLILVEVQPTGQFFMADVPGTFIGSEFGVFEMTEVESFIEFNNQVTARLNASVE